MAKLRNLAKSIVYCIERMKIKLFVKRAHYILAFSSKSSKDSISKAPMACFEGRERERQNITLSPHVHM